MRNCILQSAATSAERRPSSAWTARAEATAPLAVSKIASTESPAMSMTRPRWASIVVRKTARAASSAATVPRSSQLIRRE